MSDFTLLTSSEQVEIHLRNEIFSGRWSEMMPGAPALAKELEVDRKTVEAALRLLEDDGLLVAQGAGRKRLIELPPGREALASMNIAILTYASQDRQLDYVTQLQHSLEKAGHQVFFPEKSLTELGMKVPRIQRMTKGVGADAWVVLGASSEVLEWFSCQDAPVFALFGRVKGLPLAGTKPDKTTALSDATRQLIALGHSRISLLAQSARRLPAPGQLESLFLDELKSHGIPTSSYNLPDWNDSTVGFHKALASLFSSTPPTALILEEAPLLFAAQQFLLNRGLRVPQDVSLICTDSDPHFSWCIPSIAHIHWENRPVVRRVVNWAANISRGKKDIRQSFTEAEFVAGGTIAPAGR